MKITTYFFSILLIFLLLINSTKVTLTYAYYTLDPVGFIEALCENKEQPELQCNGKCQLMKVSKTEDNKQQTPETLIDFKDITLYHYSTSKLILGERFFVKKAPYLFYNNLYSFKKISDCFHPPRV